MNSFNSMQSGINKRTKAGPGSFTITGATTATPIIYGTYSICLFTGNGSIKTPNSSIKIGYLVVGGGGASYGSTSRGGPGGGVNYCNYALSVVNLSANATYSIAVGSGVSASGNNSAPNGGTSSITGTNVSIVAAGAAQSGAAVVTTLLQSGQYTSGAGGSGSSTGNAGAGGAGLTLNTVFGSEINMTGNVGGGGGGGSTFNTGTGGNGGAGGGGGGYSLNSTVGTGGAGVVTFGTASSFGANGTSGSKTGIGGNGGASTGGGAGTYYSSSSSGSGVVLVYWKTI